jgi:hypothetical protein
MNEIKLSLTIEDANVVLEALGNLPFARVYTLVAKIQEQAARQLEAAESARPQAGGAQVASAVTALR